MFENILTNIFKGIIYSVLIGFIGIPISFIFKWNIIKGIYVMIFLLGVIALFLAVIFFVGTPKARYEYFTGKKYKGKIGEKASDDSQKSFESRAGNPAIIGVVMIIIGFLIEALTH